MRTIPPGSSMPEKMAKLRAGVACDLSRVFKRAVKNAQTFGFLASARRAHMGFGVAQPVLRQPQHLLQRPQRNPLGAGLPFAAIVLLRRLRVS